MPAPSTSQDWSGGGERVPKSLSVRTPICPSGGLVWDRDEHAASTIHRAGQAREASGGGSCRAERRISRIYPGECQLVSFPSEAALYRKEATFRCHDAPELLMGWLPLETIEQVHVQPRFLRTHLRRLPSGIEHIVNRDPGA